MLEVPGAALCIVFDQRFTAWPSTLPLGAISRLTTAMVATSKYLKQQGMVSFQFQSASFFTPIWIMFSSLKNILWRKLLKHLSQAVHCAIGKVFLKGSTIVHCEWLSSLSKDNARHLGSMKSASAVLSMNIMTVMFLKIDSNYRSTVLSLLLAYNCLR